MHKLHWDLVVDHLQKRELSLLSKLSQSTQSFNIIDLAKEFKVTKQTLYTTLQFLDTKTPDEIEFHLTSKNVTLRILKGGSVEHFIVSELKKSQTYRLLLGLCQGKEEKSSFWSEELFISESSLYRISKKLAPVLARYELSLEFNPIKIIGEEKAQRIFLLHFLEGLYEPEELVSLEEFEFYNSLTPQLISTLNYSLEYDYKRFFYIMYISVTRILQSKHVTIEEKILKNYTSKKTYQDFFQVYSSWLETHFNLKEIAESEALYNYIACINAIIYTGPLYLENSFMRDDKDPLIFNQFVSIFDRAHLVKILDEKKADALIFVLSSFLYNLHELIQLSPFFEIRRNSTKNLLKKHHNRTFYYWYNMLKTSPLIRKGHFTYLEDIAAVFTMISFGVIYNDTIRNTNILLALSGEPGSLIYTTSLFRNFVPDSTNIEFLYNNHVTQEYILENNISLCISNFPLDMVVDNCKFINISYIPTENDWRLIKENLFGLARKF